MLEYEGPLQRATGSQTLWLILLGPLVGLLWQVLGARARLRNARGEAFRHELRRAAWAGIFGIACANLALAWQAVALVARPAGERLLYDHVARGVRLPMLEAPLDLWLEPRTAACCALPCVGAAVAAFALMRGPSFERTWRPWAWLQLALCGALLTLLADSLVTAAFGLAIVAAAATWLAGWSDARASIAAAPWGLVAAGAVFVGAALLFWGLGGQWDEDGYLPELPAGFATVRLDAPGGAPFEPAAGDRATLSMTAPPEGLVTLDDAPRPSMRAPFLGSGIAPGAHALRIDTGEGPGDATAGHVLLTAGEDLALVPIGSTLSLHATRDQLGLRLRGEATIHEALASRAGPAGVSVVAGVLLALLVAGVAMGAVRAPLRAPAPLAAVGAVLAMVPPLLLARVDYLFPLALHTGNLIAAIGAALVLGATWRALAHDDPASRALVFADGAAAGIAYVVLGLGGATLGLATAGALGLGAAALHLALGRRPVDRSGVLGEVTADSALEGALERLGGLVASMDRWVIGAVADAAAAAARAAAWLVAMTDEHLVASPGERVAGGVTRAAHAIEPMLGVTLDRVAWGVLALGGVLALLHALWPGG